MTTMKQDINVNYLNVSCDEIFDVVKWKDARVLASLLVLAFINVTVIVGNCLVIAAVFISTKLRTVTNLFIVSLAVADLMVGLAVLPFSATWEIFEIWIFGEVWCSMWLAVDVWMCTASILNLCAISLDRYVAVTRPVTYPSIMSSKKAKILIAAVWILSFLICFPPLVGWNDRKRTFYRQLANVSTTTSTPILWDHSFGELGEGGTEDPSDSTSWLLSPPRDDLATTTTEIVLMYHEEECTFTCELTNDKGYVLYSAFGSFFLPMFVMLFFYWKIYRAAVETTRAINQGFRTTKGSRLLGTRFEEQRLTLRIHRGTNRSSTQHHHNCPPSPKPGGSGSGSGMSSSPANGRLLGAGSGGSSSGSRIPRSRSHERLKVHLTPPPRGSKRSASYRARSTVEGPTIPSPNGLRASTSSTSSSFTSQGGSRRDKRRNNHHHHCIVEMEGGTRLAASSSRRHGSRRQSADSDHSSPSPTPTLGRTGSASGGVGATKYETLSSSSAEDAKPKLISKMGKRNIKAQVKRFRMETKAAKTLGIIVGGFIGCWCPFFTIYVIRAFCPTCVPPLLFSILFWLGYCNSAINPCIYALFSKDFRFAFKKILCRCLCQKERKPRLAVVPIFLSSLGEEDSDNNQNQGNNGNDHDDHEVDHDGSDSR